jgi:hypothetical protein
MNFWYSMVLLAKHSGFGADGSGGGCFALSSPGDCCSVVKLVKIALPLFGSAQHLPQYWQAVQPVTAQTNGRKPNLYEWSFDHQLFNN